MLFYISTLLLGSFLISESGACELVPDFSGSCFDLVASPYITHAVSQFGPLIEGAGVNRRGEVFAVDYGDSQTTYQLGQVAPEQKLFFRDTDQSSYFNGIRYLNSETAFIADVVNHRILKLTVQPDNVVSKSEVFCSDPNMLQPNDLTLSVTGTVFTSGMRWLADTNNTHGDIWSCLPNGTVQRLELLGRTNGIDLTPDEQHLYVSESYNRGGNAYSQKIWKYRVNVADGSIPFKTLFADFERLDGSVTYDIDGMKTDVQGNLFVARYGGRHVAILSPAGLLIGKIAVSFPNPTNIELGGPNGTTLFIVGQCSQEGKGCVDQIDLVSPGRSWSHLQMTK